MARSKNTPKKKTKRSDSKQEPRSKKPSLHSNRTNTVMRAAIYEEVVRLRGEGDGFAEIAEKTGVSVSTAYRYCLADTKRIGEIREVRQRATAIQVDEWVAAEWATTDSLIEAVVENAEKGHYDAIEILLKIMDRRAKYRGLYAPERMDHSITPMTSRDEFFKRVEEKLAELERLGKSQTQDDSPPLGELDSDDE